jgi:Permuted papain-like amidase enzyme, YaeF/YiiX, C92 family
MKLSDAVPYIMPGDVLLFRGKKLHSQVIERVSHSVYSHAALIVGHLPGEVISRFPHDGPRPSVTLAEALEPQGVRLYPLDKYLRECQAEGCQVDWFTLKIDGWARLVPVIVDFAVKQIGQPYDMEQVIWSFSWVGTFLQRWLHLPINLGNKSWFCSRLVAGAYKHAGLPIPKIPQEMSPEDVAELSYLHFRDSLEADEAVELKAA